MIVDLRSDTVTQPSAAMRRAMADAAVGDDVWGEDPTAKALEARTAELLGKEGALFVPSGTMANQIAVMLHGRAGDEIVVAKNAHVRLYETGGAAAWAGVQLAEVGEGGLYGPEDVDAVLHPDDSHAPRTVAIAIENTHNRSGGRAWPLPALDRITAHAQQRKLAVHVDGARLWNAAVALGVPEARLVGGADTVSVCFSKGLGAPAGSVIAGTKAHMKEALRLRKRLGGGMRQVGILCAGALHALEHHRTLIVEDHRRAQRLAQGIAAIAPSSIDPQAVETNIVIFQAPDPRALCAALQKEGVLLAPFGPGAVRAVTHLDVDDAGIERALSVLRSVWAFAPGASL
jgi:threonine aldolase